MASGSVKRPSKMATETLYEGAAFDGVYLKNPTSHAGTVTFAQLYRYGNVMFLSVRMEVIGSISQYALETLVYLDESLWPPTAFRTVAVSSSEPGKVCGVISVGASDGQISFAPSAALSGTLDIRFNLIYLIA